MRVTKRTQLVQVLLDGRWQWLFCRNERDNSPIPTADYRKGQPADGLDYFRGRMGNHRFRVISPQAFNGPTITRVESIRRERENAKLFPVGLIDHHNEAGLPCECCNRAETAGDCFEDKDGAHICNRCYWTRTDRLPAKGGV